MTAVPSSGRTSGHVRYRPGCRDAAGSKAAALEQLFDAHARDGHIDVEYRPRAFAGTLS